MTALSQICEVPCYQSYCVLNCGRGFAEPLIRQRHCRRFVKCLLAELIVSWIVSEVSPSFALFKICECLFSGFVGSSYGRGFADNLNDKSMVVVCKFISQVYCDFSCGRDLGIRLWVKTTRAESRIRVIQVFIFSLLCVLKG